MALLWPPKDPGETLDYDLDWTVRLNGDIIATSSWSITIGDDVLSINSNTVSPSVTKVWLSGGTLGLKYTLQNIITTAAGDTMVESVTVTMKTK